MDYDAQLKIEPGLASASSVRQARALRIKTPSYISSLDHVGDNMSAVMDSLVYIDHGSVS